MASDDEDYEYYEYSENDDEDGQSRAGDNEMEWSSENPNAAPMTFKGKLERNLLLALLFPHALSDCFVFLASSCCQ
jgi:hypothetical protein